MPTLNDSINIPLTGYQPVQSGTNPLAATNETDLQPGLSGFSRGPLPVVSNSSPDSLRTFYVGSKLPQNRVYNVTPVTPSVTTVNNVTNTTVTPTVSQSPTTGFTSGSNSNGYWAQDPTGLIRQWGTCANTGPGSTSTQTFPKPFSSSTDIVVIIGQVRPTGQNTSLASVIPSSVTASTFQFTMANDSSGSINGSAAPTFFAIGY